MFTTPEIHSLALVSLFIYTYLYLMIPLLFKKIKPASSRRVSEAKKNHGRALKNTKGDYQQEKPGSG